MPKVTVHSYKIPNIYAGDYTLVKGKATLERIALHEAPVVIDRTAQVIDDSLLNEDGHYYGPNESHGESNQEA